MNNIIKIEFNRKKKKSMQRKRKKWRKKKARVGRIKRGIKVDRMITRGGGEKGKQKKTTVKDRNGRDRIKNDFKKNERKFELITNQNLHPPPPPPLYP